MLKQIHCETLKSWNEIHSHAMPRWLFRGQQSAHWNLTTSLERFCDMNGYALEMRRDKEDQFLREFGRAYHHYQKRIPTTTIEWLSVMQHHGAPTRLLDFTYSVYIAAYFAVERASDDCAVWCINRDWVLKRLVSQFRISRSEPGFFDYIRNQPADGEKDQLKRLCFKEPYVRALWPRNPYHLNERLRIQQGVFLIPTDVCATFQDNLQALDG
jgi:hypothetical protein